MRISCSSSFSTSYFFFLQAEDGIRDGHMTGVQTCALPIYDLNGGGRANFSFSVAQVCATAAQSSYYFPKSDLAAAAFGLPAVESGSMRGYGTLQSMTMTELMVDELAAELDMDAIELRRRNVLLPQYPNTQGAVQLGDPRLEEMLEKAAEHPLWKEKDQKKAEFDEANPGKKYEIGRAHV